MGILRKLREWREKTDGTLEGPALSTGSVVDANDGQAWETLREMGYEKGDIITLCTFGGKNSSDTVSSTSWEPSFDAFQLRAWRWDQFAPADSTFAVLLAGQGIQNSTETYEWRIQDTSNGHTLVQSAQYSSNADINTGWEEFTPSSPTSLTAIKLQGKNDTGADESGIQDANIHFGVKL